MTTKHKNSGYCTQQKSHCRTCGTVERYIIHLC